MWNYPALNVYTALLGGAGAGSFSDAGWKQVLGCLSLTQPLQDRIGWSMSDRADGTVLGTYQPREKCQRLSFRVYFIQPDLIRKLFYELAISYEFVQCNWYKNIQLKKKIA